MVLTFDVISCHVPSMLSTLAVTPRLPFVPTSCATRVTSEANVTSLSTIELIVLTSLRTSPDASIVTF